MHENHVAVGDKPILCLQHEGSPPQRNFNRCSTVDDIQSLFVNAVSPPSTARRYQYLPALILQQRNAQAQDSGKGRSAPASCLWSKELFCSRTSMPAQLPVHPQNKVYLTQKKENRFVYNKLLNSHQATSPEIGAAYNMERIRCLMTMMFVELPSKN